MKELQRELHTTAISPSLHLFSGHIYDIKRERDHLLLVQQNLILTYEPQQKIVLEIVVFEGMRAVTSDMDQTTWILCADKTVRMSKKRQNGFFTQFAVTHDFGRSIAVTKKRRVVLLTDQIEIYEQSPSSKWSRNLALSSPINRKFSFSAGSHLAVDSMDRTIVCDKDNHRVVVLSEDFKDEIDLSTRFQFDYPAAVALDEMDNIFVAESNSKRVVMFDQNGNYLKAFHHSLDYYASTLAVLDDSIYVSSGNQVQEVIMN